MFDIWRLKWQRWRIQQAYREDYKKLKENKAPADEFRQLDASEYFDTREIESVIDSRTSRRLTDQARSLDVETPPLSAKEMWIHHEDGERVWLSAKGRSQVRKLIDEEKARRFEVKTRWVTKIILPLAGILVGIIGAITGLVAVLHKK
jgi:hypothetical protein